MIILRKKIKNFSISFIKEKLFGRRWKKKRPRRDPTPPRFPIPPQWENLPTAIYLEFGQQYNKDMRDLGGERRRITKIAIEELKMGFYDLDNPENIKRGYKFDTHYLSDFSRPSRYMRFTKSINLSDRLDYLVYPPVLWDGVVITPIVVLSCQGHNIVGLRHYSETEEEINENQDKI